MAPNTYLDLNERAVVALRSRFQNNLNNYIDLINATTAANPSRDQTVIDYPVQILDAPPVAGQLSAFPIVAVADGDMSLEDDVGWGATGAYILYGIAYVTSPDPATLAWRLRRYAQAIASTALYGRELDGGGWGTIMRRVVPGQRLTRQNPSTNQTEVMSFVAVEFTVKDEQNTPT